MGAKASIFASAKADSTTENAIFGHCQGVLRRVG